MEDRHAALTDIMRIANRLSREMSAAGASCGEELTGINARILAFIDAAGTDVFQRDLEEAFDVRRSTVSHVVRRMEQKGLLRRESDPRDGRLKRLVLTERSRARCRAVCEDMQALEDRAMSCLTPGELETLRALLSRISRALES